MYCHKIGVWLSLPCSFALKSHPSTTSVWIYFIIRQASVVTLISISARYCIWSERFAWINNPYTSLNNINSNECNFNEMNYTIMLNAQRHAMMSECGRQAISVAMADIYVVLLINRIAIVFHISAAITSVHFVHWWRFTCDWISTK